MVSRDSQWHTSTSGLHTLVWIQINCGLPNNRGRYCPLLLGSASISEASLMLLVASNFGPCSCLFTKAVYMPSRSRSSSCVPLSTIRPSEMTATVSALLTVESRWAITRTVLPFIKESIASCTRYSLSASRALVASSRRSTRGFISKALAMAILCFCPPDNLIPRSPTTVLYWSGKPHMKLCAFAILAALSTSAKFVVPSSP
uniref:Uncharacterized protein n=1 Tax=Zea mays TaxID=4577 RepID=C4IZV7_MAIZE|nr:unknown [Zea mays]